MAATLLHRSRTPATRSRLQGGTNRILVAANNGGVANVGIGNDATSGYALDVTGDTNTSGGYRIGGNTALTNSSLTFNGGAPANISSASGQDSTSTVLAA